YQHCSAVDHVTRSFAQNQPLVHLLRWPCDVNANINYSDATLRYELIDRGLQTVPTPKRPAKAPDLSSIHRMLASSYYKGNVQFKGATYDALHEPLDAPAVSYR